ncbi:MAG: 7-carboxy-7-deazaguanine synthase QueE [Gammaproteobacteria bacterium]|nr:7-carboxy-7-deazaguanine synthase QueE [Gammaproteobacteria bacterium]MBU2249848.1 7-carboxy-7-deazaguanine synthase QueE [Gammaproteobacteria bacterium]
MLEIYEIFESVFGEGLNIGLPCTFIRFQGCNCSCLWCDSKYAQKQGTSKMMKEEDIIQEVEKYNNVWVTITGGEPTLQDYGFLVERLRERYHMVQLETNGTTWPRKDFYINRIAMSPKLPSAGFESTRKMKYQLIERLRRKDELKFVIADETDFEAAIWLLQQYKVRCAVIFQPQGGIDGEWIVEKIMKSNLSKLHTRVLPQLHKVFNVQ